MDYFCATCNSEAFVSPDGDIRRTCAHLHSTIVAPRTSTLYGEGHSEGNADLGSMLLSAIEAILRAFRGK